MSKKYVCAYICVRMCTYIFLRHSTIIIVVVIIIIYIQEARIPITDGQIQALINTLDQDGDGELDFR